jgi:hypothetical protein
VRTRGNVFLVVDCRWESVGLRGNAAVERRDVLDETQMPDYPPVAALDGVRFNAATDSATRATAP